jgi:hypothetical protein
MGIAGGDLVVNPGKEFELKLRNDIINQVMKRAVEKMSKSMDALIAREILPKTDLGLAREIWEKDLSAGTVNDYNALVSNYDLSDKRLIAFYGIKKPSKGEDIVTMVRFRLGEEKVISYWNVEDMEPGDIAVVLDAHDAVIYDPKDKVDVYYYIEATGKTRLVPLGNTVEVKETVYGPKEWI